MVTIKKESEQMRMSIYSILVLFVIGFSLSSYGQKQSSPRNNIKIYSREWNSSYKYPLTTENFKTGYIHYFETVEPGINTLFMNYDDCVKKLTTQKEIFKPATSRLVIVSALVELT